MDELDENGNQVFKLVPTDYYQGGWKPIDDRDYVYAGGGTTTPTSLPDPDMEMNYIGDTARAVGYALMGIVVLGAVVAFFWLAWYKNERVLRSSQPLFLFMVALGSLVMASSIVPLSLEEPVPESGLDIACMSAPWLYLSGAVIAFSALLAKTRGVRHVS
jgi:gamma-aminobutyric acid type B receptor